MSEETKKVITEEDNEHFNNGLSAAIDIANVVMKEKREKVKNAFIVVMITVFAAAIWSGM